MNAVMDRYEASDMEANATRPATRAMPVTITTTLYDLVAAIQTALGPDQEDQVVPTVARMLRTSRVALLSA